MKKSMWFILAATVLYAALGVVRFFSSVSGMALVVTMVSELFAPACVIACVLCDRKCGKISWVLFSAATAWMAVRKITTSLSTWRVAIVNPEVLSVWLFIAFDVLLIVGLVLMFVGSLRGFRRAALAQFGAFLNAGATALYIVTALIGARVVSYFERVPDSVTAFNWIVLFVYIATMLFFAGLGVFAVEKRRENRLEEHISK